MGDSVTAGSDHNPETEATEDTNNGKDKGKLKYKFPCNILGT